MTPTEKIEHWIICDIDGTVADISHRLHTIQGEKKNWDAFHKLAPLDAPKPNVIDILHTYKSDWRKVRVAMVTGRPERYRKQTAEWLRDHSIPCDELYMRGSFDRRSDYVVKQEIFNAHLADRNILFALEDRDAVVDMWRRNKVTCLQVQRGDY